MYSPKLDSESPPVEHFSGSRPSGNDAPTSKPPHVSTAALLRNPLLGFTHHELMADVDDFTNKYGLNEHREAFRKGALVAQVSNRPSGFEALNMLDDSEKDVLRREDTHRWHQSKTLYFLCLLCAGSAVVQGMDQTAVNGAQEYYYATFGIEDDTTMQGLLNGAPYLCSAFWYNLLLARFGLGLAVGAKSSTTPVYSAECTPKTIRGALTMMWQMWTAFGIVLGLVVSVAFRNTDFLGENTQWRWMLASTCVPPGVVMVQVYFCPESPRWYMEKGKYQQAYASVCRLRLHTIQATRDLYYAHKLLQIETEARSGHDWKEFFTVRRNRRAATSSFLCMFMQQFCGINIVMYYSTAIFETSGFTRSDALLTSMGMGLINWLFALPAFLTIDSSAGRRGLLLITYPLMALSLVFTAFSFLVPEGTGRLACVATGIYVFAAVYSPGAGPVPFTYSAEAFPLHIRDVGMASATAVTWGFNFIISFTWPSMVDSFGPTGAFLWYAGWNVFGFVATYLFLPETKGLTLEELDSVFSVRNRDHARYYASKAPWYANKYLLRRDVAPFPAMYEPNDHVGQDGEARGDSDVQQNLAVHHSETSEK
ncbi:Arabinose-proton symporter [Colletotrichum trifolii]|uniref:Arabinose-proton symporter n=1 Tax=Colletotrichum trifolii TaxID=5466 RepID=A0A4R8Q119_COLTR|nr:Arabinose-proton symporter [Colletotrichum trifolii]TDZ30530.1 Arabinose-proton symporter [Colletotrichum trifolii]